MNEVLFLNEATAARRRVGLSLAVDATDGITAEPGSAVTEAPCKLLANKGGEATDTTNNIVFPDDDECPGAAYIELTGTELTTLGVGNHRVYFKSSEVAVMIADFSITPDNIWAASPTSFPIADGGITSATFAAGALNATAIADNAITAAKIATDAISNTKIADNAISAAKLATGVITAAKFAAGAIDNAAIAANAIAATNIADSTITANKIAASAITSTKFAGGAISSATLQSGTINSTTLADNAITAAKIATNAIDADALATDAITEIVNAIQNFEPETGWSNTELARLIASVLLGKNTGNTFRDINDTKARVTATVVGGNRTALTLDAS